MSISPIDFPNNGFPSGGVGADNYPWPGSSQKEIKDMLDHYPPDRTPDKIRGYRKEFFASLLFSAIITVYLIIGEIFNNTDSMRVLGDSLLFFFLFFCVFFGIFIFLSYTYKQIKKRRHRKKHV
jgi:hypothetical protein